jgi:glutathione S-transferase
MDLRTITMGFLAPASVARKSPKTLEAYAKEGAPDPKRDKEVAWWRRFAEVGVTDAAARASAAAFGRAFDQLDARLARDSWLLGDRISVLEIAWFISVHRLALASYPLERHPHLRAHYDRLLQRPAFAAEVESRGLPALVKRGYGAYRKLAGTTLGDLLAAG